MGDWMYLACTTGAMLRLMLMALLYRGIFASSMSISAPPWLCPTKPIWERAVER